MNITEEQPPTPDLRGVIEHHVERYLATLEGPQPGRVIGYDADRQVVTVEPLVQRIIASEDGARVPRTRPILPDLPVLFVGGSGGRFTYPIENGDLALIVPCGAAISRWLMRDDVAITDPGEERGTLQDAFAIVGIHRPGAVPTSAPEDAAVVHAEDLLKLGGPTGTEPVIRTSDLQTTLTNFFTDSTITTALAGISLPGGVAAWTAAVAAYFVTNPVEGSDKVEAQ